MNRDYQWQILITINAPLRKVWDTCDDLSLITSYHPVVKNVEMISGTDKRAEGVSYRCNIPSGPRKGWCTEKIIRYEKYKSMTITIPEDSWGLHETLQDFSCDLILKEISPSKTELILKNYYNPRGLKGFIINTFFKRKMKKQALETFQGLKEMIETDKQ